MSHTIKLTDRNDVRQLVREKYGTAAQSVLNGQGAACCGGNAGGGSTSCGCGDVITGGLYDNVDAASIPEAALLASLGCGNPTALAALNAGEIVLDLGSGGGIDVLLSAKRVGPTGYAYGLDMTDEMLALAEKNKVESGATNVAFLKGHIEEIPLPDNSVDVIISNCVINLSADKDAVLREAFRVLKPGGRFAVSDVVVEGELPLAVRADLEAFVGCVAGALESSDYLARLKQAGFTEASIEPTRRYTFADLEGSSCCSPQVAALTAEEKISLDGRVMGAFIRANKSLMVQPTPKNGTVFSQVIPLTARQEVVSRDIPTQSEAMKLSTFKSLLEAHRDKQFRIVLPNDNAVPINFHITEVAHVQKRFIDCGGSVHTNHTCQLQVWVWTDMEHRLLAGKMADVLIKSAKVLPVDKDLDLEIEYEDVTISQYPVAGHTVTNDSVTLHLGYKHTDCLAKDICCPPSLSLTAVASQSTVSGCGTGCNC